MAECDVKDSLTVNFKVGSFTIAADDQRKLVELAQKASSLTSCLIEVKGFADSTGNAAMNTKLSENRADAVTNYLVQQGVPIRHIVAPGAYGETFCGGIERDRVWQSRKSPSRGKVLMNKGITGS